MFYSLKLLWLFFSKQFFRAWGPASGRSAGSWQADAFQDHWHAIEEKGPGGGGIAKYGDGYGSRNNSLASPTSAGPASAVTLWVSATVLPGHGGGLPRVASDTRPPNISAPVILYLGGTAQV